MKAIVITRPGPPSVLEPADRPDPSPGRGEVVVDVHATALNRADLLQRLGRYPAPPGSPAEIPGLEFAGRIASCGEGVRRLAAGERVMGILGGGGYAEKVAVDERLCLPVPEGMDWIEAAAVPEAFLTAWDALFEKGRLRPGGTVLVQAAASGVGLAAVQLAAARGIRVLALSRDPGRRKRLEEIAPIHVLDPAADDTEEAVRELSGGEGVDAVLDMVGAPAWEFNLRALRRSGRLVLVGLLGGARIRADLSMLLVKRLTVIGTVLRSRSVEEKAALTERFRQQAMPILAAGTAGPVVDRVLPLADAALAHEAMQADEHFGKIVLQVR